MEDDQLDNIVDLTSYVNKPKVKPFQKEVEVKSIILNSMFHISCYLFVLIL